MPATAGRVPCPRTTASIPAPPYRPTVSGRTRSVTILMHPTNRKTRKQFLLHRPTRRMPMLAVRVYLHLFAFPLTLMRRGSCKRCGRVGHLTYQCRNFLSGKEDIGQRKDPVAIQAAVLTGMERIKKNVKSGDVVEESSDEDSDSDNVDSDYDSEIERAIGEKFGRNTSGGKTMESKSKSRRKRRYSDESEDEEHRRRRKDRKNKRSHRHSEDKKQHKRRRENSESNFGVDHSDDSRVGREKSRSNTKSRKHRCDGD